MIKKIASIALLSTGLVGGSFTQEKKQFSYEYTIVLNSNSMKDILDGYTYKEIF